MPYLYSFYWVLQVTKSFSFCEQNLGWMSTYLLYLDFKSRHSIIRYRINSSSKKKHFTCLVVFHIEAMGKIQQNLWPFWSSVKDLSNATLLVALVYSFRNGARKCKNVAFWESWKNHLQYSIEEGLRILLRLCKDDSAEK